MNSQIIPGQIQESSSDLSLNQIEQQELVTLQYTNQIGFNTFTNSHENVKVKNRTKYFFCFCR